jgi:hypothetical protein
LSASGGFIRLWWIYPPRINFVVSGLGGCENCLHPADLSIGQPDLDTMGMIGRIGQDLSDNTPGQSAGSLVFFQHDINFYSGSNICPVSSIHYLRSLTIKAT